MMNNKVKRRSTVRAFMSDDFCEVLIAVEHFLSQLIYITKTSGSDPKLLNEVMQLEL